MGIETTADARYTIRRQVFKFFGAGFHIYNPEGSVVGYCKQKAFKLKEDLRIYTSDTLQEELLAIRTPHVIDFGATYTVALPDGTELGAFKRRGIKSMFRDQWQVMAPDGNLIAEITEDSGTKAITRRLLGDYAWLMPQTLHMRRPNEDDPIASFRTHFNPFVHRLGVYIHQDDDALDDLMILAGGMLLGAIEGRQG